MYIVAPIALMNASTVTEYSSMAMYIDARELAPSAAMLLPASEPLSIHVV